VTKAAALAQQRNRLLISRLECVLLLKIDSGGICEYAADDFEHLVQVTVKDIASLSECASLRE